MEIQKKFQDLNAKRDKRTNNKSSSYFYTCPKSTSPNDDFNRVGDVKRQIQNDAFFKLSFPRNIEPARNLQTSNTYFGSYAKLTPYEHHISLHTCALSGAVIRSFRARRDTTNATQNCSLSQKD